MADETQAPAPKEIGYVHAGSEESIRGVDEEHVDELRWPQCLDTYAEMRKDSSVASLLKAVTLPIRATPWRIDPAGAPDEVTEFVARQLGLPIIGEEAKDALPRRSRRFSWSEHLRMALWMLPYGAMYFEQVVELDDQGRWGLRKLAPRMPKSLADIHVARDGGLIAIEQKAPTGGNLIRPTRSSGRTIIPVTRLVAYVNDREGADWTGESLLRPAFKHWMLRDRLLKVEAVTHERNGMGVPVYINPPNASDEQIEKGRAMAQAYAAGDQSGVSLPFDSKLQLLGVTGQLPDPRGAIEYHDAMIGKTGLAHFLNLDGKGGSYALATTQGDLFTTSLAATADAIADVANEHIVNDLVDWNFGEDVPAPRIVFDDMRSTSVEVANALRTLADAGLIRPDRGIEEWLRREMGAPAKDTPPPETPWTPDQGGGDDAGNTNSPESADPA